VLAREKKKKKKKRHMWSVVVEVSYELAACRETDRQTDRKTDSDRYVAVRHRGAVCREYEI